MKLSGARSGGAECAAVPRHRLASVVAESGGLAYLSFCLSFHRASFDWTGAYLLDTASDLSCNDSTGQHALDGCQLSCNPLRVTQDRGSSACQSASCHQTEYLVPAPQWSPRSGG
jgi:hypothetical protein